MPTPAATVPPAQPATVPTAPATVTPTPPPAVAAVATSNWFRSGPPAAGQGSGTSETGSRDPQAGDAQAGTEGWATGKHAAQIIANPVHGDQTAAGLPVRIPRANLLPGSAGGGRRSGTGAGGRPGDGHETRTPGAPQPQRSPDKARSRLSGFQHGTRRAKAAEGTTGVQTPRSEEGADR
jgi:hypothetical protein